MTSSIRKTLTSKQKKDVDEYLSINRLSILNNYKNLWDGIKYYRDLDGKLSANQIKSLPNVPMSHPFVERLIGSSRRELPYHHGRSVVAVCFNYL